MDIDLLSKMVAELILDNDEVALPGLGSFVAEFVPSSFSDKGYTINPPYRRLSFRQRESSDTKLIDFYAKENHLDSETAASILSKFLQEMGDVLKVKKAIVFPGLGRLRATKENNFFFVPNEDLNIYPEGFGLEPVSMKTHVETEDEVQAAMENLQSIIGPFSTPAVEPGPAVEPESTVEPESAVEPEPSEEYEPVVETAAELEPAIDPEPVVEPEAELEPAIEPEAAVEPEPAADAPLWDKAEPKRRMPAGWKAVIFTAAAILLFFLLFFAVAGLAPDFIDKILYNKEELELIRTFQL